MKSISGQKGVFAFQNVWIFIRIFMKIINYENFTYGCQWVCWKKVIT